MKTAEQIADEIEALNRQYRREYWEAKQRNPDGILGMRCAMTDDVAVQEILRERSYRQLERAGRRWAMWRNKRILDSILKTDQSFGMAELVER